MNSEVGRKKKNVQIKAIQGIVGFKSYRRHRITRKKPTPVFSGNNWTNNVPLGKLYFNSGEYVMMTIIENKISYINHHKAKKDVEQDDGDLY